jgi:hypothetical protein
MSSALSLFDNLVIDNISYGNFAFGNLEFDIAS